MPTNSELAHRVIALERLLNLNDPTLQSVFHLSSACANMLGLLLNSEHVPLTLPPDLKYLGTPRATVERLRKQLHPFGIGVQVRRGLGYYMLPADKQEVKLRMERARTPELPLPAPDITERDRACIRACENIPFADLMNPDITLIAVPSGLAKAVRWLADHPPEKRI